VHGGRFNPKGTPALYVALDPMTAIKEAAQGFARKFEPCVLCKYEIDCEDVVDLRGEKERRGAKTSLEDMACAWFADAAAGREPASWRLARSLIAGDAAGLIAQSFVTGAGAGDVNLVLWDWSDRLPHRVTVFDPSGRLPRNQLSWS
jgi:RES domain-containing protein